MVRRSPRKPRLNVNTLCHVFGIRAPYETCNSIEMLPEASDSSFLIRLYFFKRRTGSAASGQCEQLHNNAQRIGSGTVRLYIDCLVPYQSSIDLLHWSDNSFQWQPRIRESITLANALAGRGHASSLPVSLPSSNRNFGNNLLFQSHTVDARGVRRP